MKTPIISLRSLVVMTLTVVATAMVSAGESGPAGNAVHLKRFEESPDQPWRHQFFQNDIDLKAEETYVLTFWARASQSLIMKVSTKVSQPPWGFFGTRSEVELTPEWQRHELTFSGEGSVPGHSRVAFGYAGTEPGDIWLADLSLRPEGADSSPNLIDNPRFEDAMSRWNSEGTQTGVFLVETQSLSEANASADESAKK